MGRSRSRRWVAASVLMLVVPSCDGGSTQATRVLTLKFGDGQLAGLGEPVERSPEIVVENGSGYGVSGVRVDCAVTEGGGSIEAAAVTTDSNGHASCGQWILGTTRGVNALTMTVDGLDPIVFRAFGGFVSPSFQLDIDLAVPGAPPEEIGSPLGNVIYRDGRFLVLIGANALEVKP